jgi:hypothetical protein
MRRPRETGIVVMMLVGLSGCASIQQKGGWASPEAVSAVGTEDRPLARLAWWRRPKAEAETPPAAAPGLSDSSSTELLAGATASPADASTDRPRLLRRLPLLSRLWNNPGRAGSDGSDRTEWKPSTPISGAGTTAFKAPAPDTGTTAFRAAVPASAGEFVRNSSTRTPQVDVATIPARNRDTTADPAVESEAGPPAPMTADSDRQLPAGGSPAPGQGNDEAVLPPATPLTGGPGPAGATPLPPLTSPSRPTPTAVSSDADTPVDVALGQPGGTTPSLPKPANQTAWATSPLSSLGSGQQPLTTSAQSGYMSPTLVETSGTKCNLLNKLCPLKKHAVLPSAQSEVTYQSCESTVPVKVKKPCFLKTFLHKKTCPGQGCGCATGGCDAHEVIASPQGTLPTSQ